MKKKIERSGSFENKTALVLSIFLLILMIIVGICIVYDINYNKHKNMNASEKDSTLVFIDTLPDFIETKREGNTLLRIKYRVEEIEYLEKAPTKINMITIDGYIYKYKTVAIPFETISIPIITKIENKKYYSGNTVYGE